jgi:hypothetical protein
MTDGERAAIALKGAEGKRLTYRQPREAALKQKARAFQRWRKKNRLKK